jgi:hypothetical protein
MWAVRQWGIGKSKSGRYAYDTRTRGEWFHDCARASTRNGQRGPTHAVHSVSTAEVPNRAYLAHTNRPRARGQRWSLRGSHGLRDSAQGRDVTR